MQLQDVVEHVLPTPKIKDRASRGPGADGGPDLGEAVSLLNSPPTSEGTGVGTGRRMESTLRGQVDQLMPTPTVKHASRSSSVTDRSPDSKAHIGTTMMDMVDELHVLPTPRATDGTNGGPAQRGSAGDLALPSAALSLLPTPDAQMGGAGGRSGDPEIARAAGHHVTINEVAQHAPPSWGPYEPAIRRWERVLGRVAPWATEPSPRSKRGRLSPRFVEWMMGWAEGWVTSVPGLSRNQQLKVLGNGVVPQQAAEAVRFLLSPPPLRESPRRPSRVPKRSTARAMLKASREAS